MTVYTSEDPNIVFEQRNSIQECATDVESCVENSPVKWEGLPFWHFLPLLLSRCLPVFIATDALRVLQGCSPSAD